LMSWNFGIPRFCNFWSWSRAIGIEDGVVASEEIEVYWLVRNIGYMFVIKLDEGRIKGG